MLYVVLCFSQSKNATLKGTIKNTRGIPVDMVNVVLKEYPMLGTTTNARGEFLLRVPARKHLTVIFSSIGYKTFQDSVWAQPEEIHIKNIALPAQNQKLAEIIVKEQRQNGVSFTSLDPKIISAIPNASGSMETMLKTLPGVSSNNELSAQYTVRGGNFDENLVYVNDVEIYRPFLIRAGRQEGLSFINSDMVSSINFSTGGFSAKYGDKMSSVLDIKYRKPSNLKGSVTVSALGATAHFEDIALKGRLTHISGIRYKTNKYLLGSLDEKGNYNPRFTDAQTCISFRISEKIDISFLGNMAQNRYKFIPETRKTTFGTIETPFSTQIYFDGQEIDNFKTYLGALTLNFHPNRDMNLKFISSAYLAKEEETYDILGKYYLNQIERSMMPDATGDSSLNLGVGSFLNHARNYLKATVYNFSLKGAYNSSNHLLNWGLKFQHEKMNDKTNEWIYRDSAGYSIPYSDSKVKLYYTLNARNKISSNRFTGYLQDTWNIRVVRGNLYLTGGIRFNYWNLNDECLLSPRATIRYFPEWKEKISFRLSAGIYNQVPFFKELKNSDGSINYATKAQKSFQIVGGTDLIFTAWNRPFRFTAEAYYKYMSHLTPYQIDNVRIRYSAEKEAVGYAAGIDLKINGEFVSGLQSWAGLSLLQTQQNIKGDNYGYYPRPTDQTLNLSLFFQDYIPGNPTCRMHLALFFGTKLPATPPCEKYNHTTFRMPPYRRIDLGFTKVLISPGKQAKGKIFQHFTDMWLSIEIFNLLNIRNTISYFWASSLEGDYYAVPNYLTGRKLNLKLTVKF